MSAFKPGATVWHSYQINGTEATRELVRERNDLSPNKIGRG